MFGIIERAPYGRTSILWTTFLFARSLVSFQSIYRSFIACNTKVKHNEKGPDVGKKKKEKKEA
jgi:hypothetical protein